jgi:two-component system NtrC family sensor kinase
MKLVFRLTILLTLSICLVFAIYLYSSVQRQADLFDLDVHRDQHVLARALASSITAVWPEHGERLASAVLEVANEREAKMHIRWVPLPPTTVTPGVALDDAALARMAAGREQSHIVRGTHGNDRLYTYRPVVVHGKTVGAIEVSESLAEENAFLRSHVQRAAVAGVVMVLVSFVLSMALGVQFVGRPVHSLIERARRIGAGDFSGRLQLRQRDELSELAEEVNAMADHLSAAHARLAEETRVRIATLEQLRHADRLTTLGRLASGIAHELGTPLNVVSWRSKMIASGETDDDETGENARIIAEQTDRMAAIIRQILNVARRPTPERSVCDVPSLVEDALALLRPFATSRNVALECSAQPAGDGVRASVDPAQIRQVLTNLVMNALDASPRGGTVTVRCSSTEVAAGGDGGASLGRRRFVRIDVADQGPGIAADALPHVFDPFFTTKPSGEGTGLGLSLAQGIAQDHGGWIEVETSIGAGTCFSVYLPEGLSEGLAA